MLKTRPRNVHRHLEIFPCRVWAHRPLGVQNSYPVSLVPGSFENGLDQSNYSPASVTLHSILLREAKTLWALRLVPSWGKDSSFSPSPFLPTPSPYAVVSPLAPLPGPQEICPGSPRMGLYSTYEFSRLTAMPSRISASSPPLTGYPVQLSSWRNNILILPWVCVEVSVEKQLPGTNFHNSTCWQSRAENPPSGMFHPLSFDATLWSSPHLRIVWSTKPFNLATSGTELYWNIKICTTFVSWGTNGRKIKEKLKSLLYDNSLSNFTWNNWIKVLKSEEKVEHGFGTAKQFDKMLIAYPGLSFCVQQFESHWKTRHVQPHPLSRNQSKYKVLFKGS